MKFYWLILIALICANPLSLFADSPKEDSELTVFSGWSFLNVDRESPLCAFCDRPFVDPTFPFFIRVRNEIGDSLMFGTKFGYYLNNKAEIEGSFAIAPNHDVTLEQTVVCPPGELCPLETAILIPNFFFTGNLIAYHYDGNFVYNLTTNDVKPYVTFGIGGVSSDTSNQVTDSVKTNLAFNFGGGIKFYFSKLAFRLEVNDHVIPNYFFTQDTQHNLQLQYGILFRIR